MIGGAGFFALAAQTLLFREFLAAFEGNELGIAWFFTTWLLWVAAGAFLARRRTAWTEWLAAHFEFLAILYAPAFLLQSWLVARARDISGVEAYELFPMVRMLPASALVNAPVSLLTGMLFTLACRWMSGEKRIAVATVYICETVGSCAGGVAVTVLLWQGVPWETVFLGASLVLAVAFCCQRLASRGWRSAAVPLIALLAVHAAGLEHAWRRANDLRAWKRLLPAEACRGSFATPQARYLYGEHRGQINVAAWGSLAESIPDTEHASAVLAVHLAQHPAARRILVVGSGCFSICARLMVLPQTESVTWVDADPDYPAQVLKILPERLKSGMERLVVPGTDARNHLRRTADRYDLVIVSLPDATTLALNRHFTREFFELLKTRLAGDGVVGVSVSGGENVLSAELINVGATAYHTLGAVFAHRTIKPGDQTWIIASDADRLSAAPAVLRDRFGAIEGAARLYPADGLMSLYLPDRIAMQEERYRAAAAAAPRGAFLNTDRRPKALFHSLQLAAREAGASASLTAALRDVAATGKPLAPGALALYALLRLVFLLKSPRRAGTRPADGVRPFENLVLVFSAGAAAMALNIILMFMFQSAFGSIFLHAGLIAALFMLGLFAGSLAVERRLVRKGSPGNLAVLLIIGLHASMVAAAARLPLDLPRGLFAALFFGGGLLSGVYVPLAAFRLKAAGIDDRGAGALVELNDHLGGACGGLLTGLILLPVFGNACALLAVACVLAVNLPPLLVGGGAAEGTAAHDRYASAVRPAGYALFGLAGFALAASLCLHIGIRPARGRLLEQAAGEMADKARRVERRHTLSDGRELNYYVVTGAGGRDAAYLFSTEPFAPDIVGYGGPLIFAVMIDAQGLLKDFRIIHSAETPAYLDLLASWMTRLKGRHLFAADALADVDAVTGATLTSAAARGALAAAGTGFAREVLGMEVGQAAPVSTAGASRFRFLAVAIPALPALVLRARPGRRRRKVFLACVAAGCGFLLNTQYSLAQVLFLLGLQLPPAGPQVVFLLVVALPLFVLLFGNVYCGYLCPFGALQELVGDWRPARFRTDPGRTAWRAGRLVKFALLFLVVLAFAPALNHALASQDPLVAVFSGRRPWFIAALASAVLALSFFYGRFWCRTLCPAGAFLALLNGARLLRPVIPVVAPDLCPFGVSSRRELDCLCCDRCRMISPGEREASRAARREPAGRRGAIFVFAAAALALLLAWRVASTVSGVGPGPARPVGAGAGQTRDVDMARLTKMIERGELSDREARYYERIPPAAEQ